MNLDDILSILTLKDPQPTSTSWSYFQELKLEHKRGRKLLKDQQLKVDGFEKFVEAFSKLS